MYRLLRDSVYLTKEYILENIFFGHAIKGQGCVCIERITEAQQNF